MNIQKRSTKEILTQNRGRGTSPLIARTSVWLHNIRSLFNVGSAFRTADAFGVEALHLSGFTPLPPRPEISKTALGAQQHVPWKAHEDAGASLDELKSKGTMIVAIEQTNRSKLLPEFLPPKNKPLCLIFGSEVSGIDNQLLPLADEWVEIPQFGEKHSFNISVSIGIVLYHIYFQSQYLT